jgi:2-amino-4-hydroxy-6-hydroxymethyldihydropteridine diphosphokinase
MNHVIYLSLGSNLGDRLANLRNAITNLSPRVSPIMQSPVYETRPWGYSDQPDFLNQVIKANTSLDPLELLEFFKDTEVMMGRKETFRFGPRLIDLDILFYDDLILETPTLTLPHPRISERAFILIPLADIAPELYHPVLNKTIQQLITGMDTSSVELYQSSKFKPEP